MNTLPLARWEPTTAAIEAANITSFARSLGVDGYPGLLAAAAADLPGFYERLIAKLELHWDAPWSQIVDLSRGKPFTTWFPDARINAAGNALDRHINAGRGAAEALVWEGEDGSVRRYSFAQLRDAVARLGRVLLDAGVVRGDRVGIFMPLIPEAAIGLLATAYIGAVAVPAFSGYGPDALSGRLADAGAKALLTVDGVLRRNKLVDMKRIADDALRSTPTVVTVLVYDRVGVDVPMQEGRDVRWRDAVAAVSPLATYAPTSADDRLMLLYTSGSTGKPKGVNHVHGGFPIKCMIDQYLCMDVNAGDRMLWYTDIGWVMGPILVFGTLGRGASIILYEGTPDFPGPDRLWKVCSDHRVTHLGIAPTAIRSLMVHGHEPPQRHDLSSLRILASSGEPWNTEPWKWFLTHIGGGRAPIINYSGGTEIGGGILGCFPTMPLSPNSFHGPIPGMLADVFSEDGRSLRGAVGELVITQPWPGMTQSLWGGDPSTNDDARYLATYWERYPDIWVHGDWAVVEEVDGETFWFILGRSDDTINVAGKRVGPAEFESALGSHVKIREAAAISVPDDLKGEVVVILVVARDPFDEGDVLREELFAIVQRMMGKSLRPKTIAFVDDLPKTRNLKVMRRVARARYLGVDPGDLSALDNFTALEAIDRRR